MDKNKDYYEVLGVSKNANAQEIKKAYRKKALKWHPDKHKGESKKQAEQKFKEINQAYEVLISPQKKQAYDQLGHSAFTQGAGPSAQGPFTYTYSSGSNIHFEDIFGGFSDPFDIFEQFFGGAYNRGSSGVKKPVYSLTLDFMEAVKGTQKQVSIEKKSKKIKIPAGVNNNTRIKFSDFDILVSVRPHKQFKRQGQDIFLDFPISFTQAVLGDTVKVPTLDGEIKLKIRAGTQPGTLIRLRGRGIPFIHSNDRGDQYIRLQIKIPKSLSKKQKDLLKEFEKKT